jgi:hypothetical protein
MDRFFLHRRLQDNFDKGSLGEPRCLQGAAIHRDFSDSVGHWQLLVVENLGLDGSRKAYVLTPVERLRTVARTGMKDTKAIRAQLASKWIYIDAAQ